MIYGDISFYRWRVRFNVMLALVGPLEIKDIQCYVNFDWATRNKGHTMLC